MKAAAEAAPEKAPGPKKKAEAAKAKPGAKKPGKPGKKEKRAPAKGKSEADAGGMSPRERHRLAKVQDRSEKKKSAQATHETAETSKLEAQAAVVEPKKELDGRQLEPHAEAVEQHEPPDPEIVAVVEKIKLAMKEKRPENEDELGTAKSQAYAEAGGTKVSGDVTEKTAAVKTDVVGTVADKPTGVSTKEVKGLEPSEPAPATPPINAAAATPDPVTQQDVSLATDQSKVDQQWKDAKMDHEGADLVQDGPIAQARQAKGEFGEFAKTAPEEVLKSDAEMRAEASADFKKREKDAIARMMAAREESIPAVDAGKGTFKTDEEKKREALGKKLDDIFVKAEIKVKAKLEAMVPVALTMWTNGIKPLSDQFEATIQEVDADIKKRKSKWYTRWWDAVTGLPGWIVRKFDGAEQTFVNGAADLAFTVSSWVAGEVKACKKLIADAKKEIKDELAKFPKELTDFALEQQAKFDKKFKELETTVESARKDFNKQLTTKLRTTVNEKRAKVAKLREMSKGLLQKIADFVSAFIDDPLKAIIDGLLNLLGIPPPTFWNMVARFAAVIDQIKDKPKVFANNLLAALKKGFEQFKTNIVSHLLKGLLDWLTSKLKDVGVEVPTEFSVKAILKLILQILGISWPRIREKLVKYIGEKNMKRIEMAIEFLTALITEGWEGLWKLLEGKLDPGAIVDAVMSAIKDYIIETIVKQATIRIVAMFNPVGAILAAVELIYKVVSWIIENAAKIFALIDSIVQGAANIMAGAIGGAANLIEGALAKLVPIVIDLFARLLGLGGLPDKVKQIVGGLQAMVDQAIDKVIAWIAGKLGLKGPEEKKGEEDSAIDDVAFFDAPDGRHKIYFEVKGQDAVPMTASTPMTVAQRLDDFQKRIEELPDLSRREKAQALLKEARKFGKRADEEADQLVRAHRESLKGKTAEEKAKIRADDELAQIMSKLYAVFGEHPGEVELPMREQYRGDAGGGELSFKLKKSPKEVSVQISGRLAEGALRKHVDQMERFASIAAKQTAPLKADKAAGDAKDAAAQAKAVEQEALAMLDAQLASASKKEKAAAKKPEDITLSKVAAKTSEVANYQILGPGELLELAVIKVAERAKKESPDKKTIFEIGTELGVKFELARMETERTESEEREVEKEKKLVGPSVPLRVTPAGVATQGVGVSVTRKGVEVKALGKYVRIIEALRSILDDGFVPKLRDAIRGIEPKVPGTTVKVAIRSDMVIEKEEAVLLKELAVLFLVEMGRAATAWAFLTAYMNEIKSAAELASILDKELFPHSQSKFVSKYEEEGPRLLEAQAKNLLAKLSKELASKLGDAVIVSAKEREESVSALEERLWQEYTKAMTS